MIRSLKWLSIILAGTALVSWIGPHTCSVVVEDARRVRPEEMSAKVRVVPIKKGTLPLVIKAIGQVVTRQQAPASVVSRMSSFVNTVEVVEGQLVEAGTVLVRLDDQLARSALSRAQNTLEVAEAELKRADEGGLEMKQSDLDLVAKQTESAAFLAAQESNRLAKLLPGGAVSQKETIVAQKQEQETAREAKSAADKANLYRSGGRGIERSLLESSVKKARADVTDAEFHLEFTVLRSPIAGCVTGLKASVGSPVSEGTGILQILGKLSTGIRFWVTPENANHILEGARATLLRDGTSTFYQGNVISVGRQLDPATGLVPIEAAIEVGDPDTLRLGEMVDVDVNTQDNVQGFLIPDSALVVRDGQSVVYGLSPDSIAHPLPVCVIVRTNRDTLITADNLAEGDLVIIDGSYNLPDGARVVAATTP